MNDKLYLRQGTTAEGAFSLVITPERAGWTYSGLATEFKDYIDRYHVETAGDA